MAWRKKIEDAAIENKILAEITNDEEWIWVEGYKGTDSDMSCRGHKYELGKPYFMPVEHVKECEKGFHLCLKLTDVFEYYKIGCGHRFFKVKALVRKSDYEEYGKYPDDVDTNNPYATTWASIIGRGKRDKLVASRIEFLRECSLNEIFQDTEYSDWSYDDKAIALEHGIDHVKKLQRDRAKVGQVDELIELGYSRAFATYIVENDKYGEAKAIGSQPELSLDVRALLIFRDEL